MCRTFQHLLHLWVEGGVGVEAPDRLVPIPAGPLLSCVILGKLLTFSVPQFPGFLICTMEVLVVSGGL